MAYSKQTWDTTSYVNPTRMNHIEDGIASVDAVSSGNATINIPVESGGWANWTKKGSLIFVVYAFKANGQVGSTDVILTNLPKATLTGNYNWIIINEETNGSGRRTQLYNSTNTASLRNYYGNALVNGETYTGSFCYIAE